MLGNRQAVARHAVAAFLVLISSSFVALAGFASATLHGFQPLLPVVVIVLAGLLIGWGAGRVPDYVPILCPLGLVPLLFPSPGVSGLWLAGMAVSAVVLGVGAGISIARGERYHW
jgi:hypothetical protein